MAEMPKDYWKAADAADGIRKDTDRERQASMASEEHISSKALRLSILHEPPYAERHVRWCERSAGELNHPPPTRSGMAQQHNLFAIFKSEALVNFYQTMGGGCDVETDTKAESAAPAASQDMKTSSQQNPPDSK